MHNSFKFSAFLSIFFFPNPSKPAEKYDLKLGENLFGSDQNLCHHVLNYPEIDNIQVKISIFDYGECSIESMSNVYDNYKEYHFLPGHTHHLKMRKNKEYDLINESIFYLSKYKAKFNIIFEELNENPAKNIYFSATLFVPDLEIQEQLEPIIPYEENKGKLDFLPTQNLDALEEESNNLQNKEKNREIKKIFQRAVEKIKKSYKGKHESIISGEEKDLTDVFFSKFVSLYDSVKEEINSMKTSNLNSTNSNSKVYSTIESSENKDVKNKEDYDGKLSLKEIEDLKINLNDKKEEASTSDKNFNDLTMRKSEGNYKDLVEDIITNPNIEIEENVVFPLNNNDLNFNNNISNISSINLCESSKKENKSPKINIILASQNNGNSENVGRIFNFIENKVNNNYDLSEKQTPIKGRQNDPNLLSPFIENQPNINKDLSPTIRESQINASPLPPTIRESQLNEDSLPLAIRESPIDQGALTPTIRESQVKNNSLAQTLRESQIEGFMAQTIRESQINNAILAPTIKESQINENLLVPTIRESQILEGVAQGNKISPISEQENFFAKFQTSKFIRDNKHNAKKRKLELQDLPKVEKKTKIERKIQEEQFQSLKLFTKDNIDDLEDLFEKDTAMKKKQEEENEKNKQNIIPEKEINIEKFEQSITEKPVETSQIEEKNTDNKILKNEKVKKKNSKNSKKKIKFIEEEKVSKEPEKKELTNENNNKPKLYLSQKSFTFTSNDSLNNSCKKNPKENEIKNYFKVKPKNLNKKMFVEEENINNNHSDAAESEENHYQLSKSNSLSKKSIENQPEKKEDEILEEKVKNEIKEEVYESDRTEKLDSDNDENEEAKKNSPKQIKSKSQSRKIAENVKISKTLTQIFNNENENEKPILSIAISGFKLSKAESHQLKNLKIEVVQNIMLQPCDALVVKAIKKEANFLIAINKGISIVAKKWLDDSLNAKSIEFLDNYHIKESDFEKQNNFFLEQSILKARLQGGFLKGYSVWSSDNKEIKKIVESAEGLFLDKMPQKNDDKTFILIDEKKRRLINEMVEKKITFYFPDFLYDACLKQELILNQ